VEVFGFHLATVDLRQSSDKHEEVVAELLSTARVHADYSSLSEEDKRSLLLGLLNDARPLRVHGVASTRPMRRVSWRFLPWPRSCASASAMRPSVTTSSATPKP